MVRDADIEYSLQGNFCVNNCFAKILKPSRSSPGEVQETVSFREYIHINEPLEIIFSVGKEEEKAFLVKYIHKINYFGKRGCFFQFIGYQEQPSNKNVFLFEDDFTKGGIIQEYDDFDKSFTFDKVNNYGGVTTVKRAKKIFILPLMRKKASKAYTNYGVSI